MPQAITLAPKKILVIRFSSIGDIVLTTPIVRCLRQQIGAEVHFLTKKNFVPILSSNPYIHRVWSFEKGLSEVLPNLKREQFDFIADLHHNLRSWQVTFLLQKPARAFDKLNIEKWLLVNTGKNFLPKIHIVHRYMATVLSLGVYYDGKGLDYFIPPEEEIVLEDFAPYLLPNKYVSVVIGATHATKRLPEEKIIELCKKIRQPIALLGGNEEAAAAEKIASAIDGQVFNFCGKLNLHGSASVLRQSEKVYTHDTGLMHIAAALRKPIYSIWGSTVPDFGMYPFYPEGLDLNKSLEVKDLSCRPCSKIGFQACPKGHFKCMNHQKFEI